MTTSDSDSFCKKHPNKIFHNKKQFFKAILRLHDAANNLIQRKCFNLQ